MEQDDHVRYNKATVVLDWRDSTWIGGQLSLTTEGCGTVSDKLRISADVPLTDENTERLVNSSCVLMTKEFLERKPRGLKFPDIVFPYYY